jgi:hypothetical protein
MLVSRSLSCRNAGDTRDTRVMQALTDAAARRERLGLSGGVKTSSSAQQTAFDSARVLDAPVAPRFSSISSRRHWQGMAPSEV